MRKSHRRFPLAESGTMSSNENRPKAAINAMPHVPTNWWKTKTNNDLTRVKTIVMSGRFGSHADKSSESTSSLNPSPDKFYKRGSQEKELPVAGFFLVFQPVWLSKTCSQLPLHGTRFVTHGRVVVLVSSPSGFHHLFTTKPVSSETNKQNGGQVPTMVLSGTRGP